MKNLPLTVHKKFSKYTPWLCNATGETIGLIYKKEDAELIAKACNCHDKLVEALKAWMLVESEMSDNHPCPDLALRADYRKRAVKLSSEALALVETEGNSNE